MLRIALALFLLLTSFVIFAAAPVYMKGMMIQPGGNMTRFTFMLSAKTYGKVKYIPHPDRVIVEFANTVKNFNMQNARLGGSVVDTMNMEQAPGVLRFIFTTKGKVHYKSALQPGKNGGAQLQVDIISDQPMSKKTVLRDINKPVAYYSRPTTSPMFTVVIDAGHGGKDPGAKGANGVKEKAVVLSIAKRLEKKINQEPGLRAIMTRKDDSFVALKDRLRFARKGKGDLFVAIHADAYYNNRASGASVYALSSHGATSVAARWLATRENHSELGGIALDHLQDRSIMLRSVLIDLAQTATIQDSLRLGNKLLHTLNDVSDLHHKHVEQAPFLVLKSPDIPSVLVETGFISSPKEEQRLADARYQEQIADALFKGIRDYVRKFAVSDM